MKMKPMMTLVMSALIIVSVVYAGSGVRMHQRVGIEEAKFHQIQSSYFIQSKQVRDGAETGSDLNRSLVAIENYPSDLLRLKLVGVGRILVGIYILLFGILIALIMMPVRLGMMLKGSGKGNEK